jgi:hypothetical protein
MSKETSNIECQRSQRLHQWLPRLPGISIVGELIIIHSSKKRKMPSSKKCRAKEVPKPREPYAIVTGDVLIMEAFMRLACIPTTASEATSPFIVFLQTL